ncbi:hypothetical protein E2C01_071217 [Portunus trituberculatus]|uniref:Uncharacterized protein n=1 Tax=Portunus trituberculatus TaxID=210409 RepID=A0A5B7I3T9_PORTR|nr:hypothetical protein [Portunus trituberculatus]
MVILETEAGSQPITAKLSRSITHPANSNPENSLKRMWLYVMRTFWSNFVLYVKPKIRYMNIRLAEYIQILRYANFATKDQKLPFIKFSHLAPFSRYCEWWRGRERYILLYYIGNILLINSYLSYYTILLSYLYYIYHSLVVFG